MKEELSIINYELAEPGGVPEDKTWKWQIQQRLREKQNAGRTVEAYGKWVGRETLSGRHLQVSRKIRLAKTQTINRRQIRAQAFPSISPIFADPHGTGGGTKG